MTNYRLQRWLSRAGTTAEVFWRLRQEGHQFEASLVICIELKYEVHRMPCFQRPRTPKKVSLKGGELGMEISRGVENYPEFNLCYNQLNK